MQNYSIKPSTFEKEHFKRLSEKHGLSHLSLEWGQETLTTRYMTADKMIVEMSSKEESPHLIDVGCGYGALAPYILPWPIGTYTGIDVTENMIRMAKEFLTKEGTDSITDLQCADYFTECQDLKADVITAIGTLSYDHSLGSVIDKVNLMYENSRLGCIFTLCSTYMPMEKRGKVAYWIPQRIFDEFLNITKYITIDHSYHDGEFMLSLSHKKHKA